jgi:hypothetical protein
MMAFALQLRKKHGKTSARKHGKTSIRGKTSASLPFLSEYHRCRQIEDDDTSGAYRSHEKNYKCLKDLFGKPEGKGTPKHQALM